MTMFRNENILNGMPEDAVQVRKILDMFDPRAVAAGFYGTDDSVSPEAYAVRKFGQGPNMPNGAWATVYDNSDNIGDYPYLSSGIPMDIVSDSATDVSKEVKIYYLDSNWERQNITVSLNGTLHVQVAEDIMFPYRMYLTTEVPLSGNVTLVDRSTQAIVYSKIRDGGNGYNQTQMATYPVPAGYTGFLYSGFSDVGSGKEMEFSVRTKQFGQAFRAQIPFVNYQSFIPIEPYFPGVLPEKTIIEIRGKAGGTGITASAQFELLIIRNDILSKIQEKFKI